MEKLYTYLRFLRNKLPRRDKSSVLNLDEDVELKYYRLQKISEGSIKLMAEEEIPVYGAANVGTGQTEPVEKKLSKIIDILNERFKTDFTPADELFINSVQEDAVNDEKIRTAAKANKLVGFSYVFNKIIDNLFADRLEQNEALTEKFLNDKVFKKFVSDYMMNQVYEKILEKEVENHQEIRQ